MTMIHLNNKPKVRPHRKVRIPAIIGITFFLIVALFFPCMVRAGEGISVAGITEPFRDVNLSATMAGVVSEILVREGDVVRKGTVLLEMEKQLDELETERRKLIRDATSELEAAAFRVRTLKWILDSNQELFNTTASVSREELEKLKLEYDLAVAEQKRLTAQEEREEIEYRMAIEALSRRSLASPIDGTVIKLFFDEGEGVEVNQPLVHLVDTSRSIFVCNVEEWIGRSLHTGQMVNLKINTGKSAMPIKGKTVFVSPVVDPASGLLEVKVEFDNKDGVVRPGVAGFLLLGR